jgi:multicomponent Na+:H+ antiporter subunit D
VMFLGSVLSFVYMFQIYQRVFLSKEPQEGYQDKASPRTVRTLVVTLAVLTLATGLWPEPLFVLGEEVAAVLTESSGEGGSP